MSVKVHYHSNNSGGYWWLTDEDWKKLERAGWHVEWGGLGFCNSKYSFNKLPTPPRCSPDEECPGHRCFESADEVKERWLGCIARSASKTVPSLRVGVEEWERVTSKDATKEGCNCCGRPHEFSGKTDTGEYVYFDTYPSSIERTYSDE